MTKLALALALASIMPSTTQASAVNLSTGAAVQWPDYHSKPWTAYEKYVWSIPLRYEVPYNSHASASMDFSVHIGIKQTFIDNPDIKKADWLVIESSCLGNEPSLRALVYLPQSKFVAAQIRIDGSWVDIRGEDRIKVSLLDPDAVLNHNELNGVLLAIYSPDGKVVVSTIIFANKK